jgi:hypothetical protein
LSKVIRLETEEEPEWFFDQEEEKKSSDFFDIKLAFRIGSGSPQPHPKSCGTPFSSNRTHLWASFCWVIFCGRCGTMNQAVSRIILRWNAPKYDLWISDVKMDKFQ